MLFQIISVLILFSFYSIYFLKMYIQSRKGIVTNQMGKGNKEESTLLTERVMQVTVYLIVVVEVISVFCIDNIPTNLDVFAAMLGFIGVIIFGVSVYTMKDSWRAGVITTNDTKIVTSGIYKYSRNPAFLAFDLVYVSILILNFNYVLLICTIFVIIMFHFQILQEEKSLPNIFGEEYLEYKAKVCRYFGRKA